MIHATPGDELSSEMVDLIRHITAPLGVTSSETLVAQAAAATITRSTSTMIDLAVPLELPVVNLNDGPIPSPAFVYEGEVLVGELLLWIRSGRLIGLEQAWYTDEPPAVWPDLRRVVRRW